MLVFLHCGIITFTSVRDLNAYSTTVKTPQASKKARNCVQSK